MYEGSWDKGKRHGDGSLIDPNIGTILKGFWRGGKLEGKTSIVESGGKIDNA